MSTEAAAPTSAVDDRRARVQARVAALDRMLRSHAGGLELQACDAAGRVQVRFTGMCVGCELRPVTAETVVQPLLEELEGVQRVEIAGGRVSEFALQALRGQACRAQHAHWQDSVRAFERTALADRE